MKHFVIPFFLFLINVNAWSQNTEPRTDDSTGSADPASFIITEPAVFQGGEEALMQFIIEETKYPRKARRKNVEGKVMVQFVVNTLGEVEQVQILGDSLGFGLEEEATRVIRATSSKWKPGTQSGEPVNSYFRIPILFQLED
jgi:TonB family protein